MESVGLFPEENESDEAGQDEAQTRTLKETSGSSETGSEQS